MTQDKTPKPTDAEAWAMWTSLPLTGSAIQSQGDFARAVLAKWGSPVVAAPVAKERFSEPLARVIHAGYLLANCAFNMAQRPGTEISIGTAQTLSDCQKEWDAACAAHKALPATPQPTQAQAGAVPQYRLLVRGQDTIQADDEFLREDGVTWRKDPSRIFVGCMYAGTIFLPARRVIEAAHAIKEGVQHAE